MEKPRGAAGARRRPWLLVVILAVLLLPVLWLILSVDHGGPDQQSAGRPPRDAARSAPQAVELAPEELPPLPGSGPLVVELHYLGPAEQAPLRPKRAGSLEGRVVDHAGQPIPSASLRVRGGPQDGLEVRAAPDGRYLFPELVPGTQLFTIEAGGTRVVRLQQILSRARTRRDFVLGDASPLALRVRDSAGQPLAEEQVRVDLGEQEASTDAEGVARFAAVPRAPRVPVDVIAPGHVPTRHELNLLPQAGAAGEPIELPPLERGGSLVGQVKSWPGGALPTVTVVPRTDRPGPQQAMWELWQDVPVNQDGFFQLEDLPTTRLLDVRVFHPEGVARPPLLARRPGAETPARVEFVIERGARRIAGRVLGPDGAPLAGALVALEAADPSSVLGALYPGLAEGPSSVRLPVPAALRRELRTGRDGSFDFAWGDHPDGTGYLVLTAIMEGMEPARTEVRSALASFTIRMRPEDRSGALSLVSGDGGPLPDEVLWFLDGAPLAAPTGLRRGLYEVFVRRGEHAVYSSTAFLVTGATGLPVR